LSASIRLERGSFGQEQEQINFKIGRANWTSSTRLLHQKAENNFSYSVRSDLPKRTQTNAGLEQFSVLQEYYIQLKEKETLNIYGWWQHSDRGIPPTSTQNKSEATQADDFLRTAIHWKRKSETHTFTTANADGYSQNPIENRTAIFGAILYQQDNWKAQLNMRQALVNAVLIPFVPSLGIEARISNK